MEAFGEYISEGQEEVGREFGMRINATTIISHKRGKMPDSTFVLQQFCRDVSKRMNYSSTVFRVLFHLFGLSEFENYVCIDVKTISDETGISEESVKRATKKLEKDNILLKMKHPSDKRRVDYFINPMAAWRGKALDRTNTISKIEKSKPSQLNLFTHSL